MLDPTTVGWQVRVTIRGGVITYPTAWGCTSAYALAEAELNARITGHEVISSEATLVETRSHSRKYVPRV